MKTLFFIYLASFGAILLFASQEEVQKPSKQEESSLASVQTSIATAISKIQDQLHLILQGYNEEGVEGGIAVYGILQNNMSSSMLTVQFYQGSNLANPSTTSILWNHAELAAVNQDFSDAFSLVDAKNNVIAYVVVGSNGKPDLDKKTLELVREIIAK